MRFENFIKIGQVRKTKKDDQLIRSLVKTAEKDLVFLESLKIDENSARKIMTNYYDVLRSILEAISLMDGFKVYSHEPFSFFLKEKGEDALAVKFDRLRKIRNGISYYGEDISVEEVIENVAEIKTVIKRLKEKYLR